MDNETVVKLADLIIPAASGLLGVLIGGLVTAWSQRTERRHAFLRRQLDEFYSPMFGMRSRILAKSASREKVSSAAHTAWRKLMSGAQPQQQMDLERLHAENFKKIIEDDNRGLAEELLPLYRQMVDRFSANIGLSEPATRRFYSAFIHFVDIWDRSERGALPAPVSEEIGHNEDALFPFYQDLADTMQRLQNELKK